MDDTQIHQLLQELETADPAEAPDLADEAARLLAEALGRGGENNDEPGDPA